jgi:hypothetical protein
MMSSFTGFAIAIDVSKTSEWQPIVLALGGAILAEGVPTRINVANDNSASPDAIHLYFGTKQ